MHKLKIASILLPLALVGAGCFGGEQPQIKPVTLQYWRAEDDPQVFAPLIAEYKKIHPNVDIVVTKFPAETFERSLLEALAEDRGPDMLSIPNVKLREWQTKLLPQPKETVIPTQTVNAQRQTIVANQKNPTLTIRELINDYVETAVKDVVLVAPPEKAGAPPEQKIYGLPLSLDTLGLFYNKDFFKKAGLDEPPALWTDVQSNAQKMTVLDGDQNIAFSGAALGAADNIPHSAEIVSSLMVQNGAQMSDENGTAAFSKNVAGNLSPYPPGIQALIFYTSFANKNAANYSWDSTLPNALDAFVSGKTAMFFGYPADAATIKGRAPKLNFGVAPLPQINPSKTINMAKYPIEVVSKKTKNPNEAWDFIQFIARAEQVGRFLTAAKRPTALRNLIQAQLDDPEIGPFAKQLLTAKSWYRGADYGAVERAFATMIMTEPNPAQRIDYANIIGAAEGAVNATIR